MTDGLAESILAMSQLLPQAQERWKQHMSDEGIDIKDRAIHVWFAVEYDPFYQKDPVWCASWYYFNEKGQYNAFLYAFAHTPLDAVVALTAKMS